MCNISTCFSEILNKHNDVSKWKKLRCTTWKTQRRIPTVQKCTCPSLKWNEFKNFLFLRQTGIRTHFIPYLGKRTFLAVIKVLAMSKGIQNLLPMSAMFAPSMSYGMQLQGLKFFTQTLLLNVTFLYFCFIIWQSCIKKYIQTQKLQSFSHEAERKLLESLIVQWYLYLRHTWLSIWTLTYLPLWMMGLI